MRPWPALAAWALMAASGFAGLGYQMVWTQQATLWLGHESAAVLAVVAAFFGGLALGAGGLGTRIERSARPARWYAACELLIALWALALVALLPLATPLLLAALGDAPGPTRHWAVAFGGLGLLLLPATAAMGATLPAMARMLALQAEPQRVAGLYAANTAGAVTGVLAIAFWGVPSLGLQRCTQLCALLNLGCAAWAAWGWPRPLAGQAARVPAPGPAPGPAPHASPAASAGMAWRQAESRRLALLLAATGLLGIGYEVLVVRVLSQVAEDTVYTFALLLAVYLVATALGAAWQGHRSRAVQRAVAARAAPPCHEATARRLLVLLAGACWLGAASLWQADALRDAGLEAGRAWLGPGAGLVAALGAEAGLALAAFALPAFVMGALFSHLAAWATATGMGLGRALACNTVGAALAPALVGVGLVQAGGTQLALAVLVACYAGLAWWAGRPAGQALAGAGAGAGVRPAGASGRPAPAVPASRPTAQPELGNAWAVATGVLVVLGAGLLAAPALRFVSLPPGGQLLAYQEGAAAAVSVTEDAEGVRRLHINNRQQEGASNTLLADGRQAWLPLLLHPAPQRVLFLGLGTGLTASVAVQDPRLSVQAVELLPEVVAASRLFHGSWADPSAASRLATTVADARRQVRAGGPGFDVVVADNMHPARSGTGSLYTVEHFAAVRARLAPQGLFCQWLPLHQMDRATLASTVAAFLQVWPDARAMLATNSLDTPTLGLIGVMGGAGGVGEPAPEGAGDRGAAVAPRSAMAQVGAAAQPIGPQQARFTGWHTGTVQARLAATSQLPRPPADFGLHDPWAVLGSLVAGPGALAQLAAGAPLNTDDRPVVAYRAPRTTYAPEDRPRDRLLALLPELALAPGEGLAPGQAAAEQRLAAYRQARHQFLHAGRQVQAVPGVQAMLAQVQAPLLAALALSPDFRPAYDPLLGMARALAQEDRAAAQALLAQLAAVAPQRPEAGQLLGAAKAP